MVLPAVVWLTHMALELDRAEALARQQADLEEAVGSALWQMDSELTRLLAPEIARPPYFFRPFYLVSGGKQGPRQLPSPLLMQPTPFVRLHFELRPDGTWTSPQCPAEEQYDLALGSNTTKANIDLSRARLAELSDMAQYDDLIAQVPDQTLQIDVDIQNQWANNQAFMGDSEQSKVVMNILDYQAVRQQLESVQGGEASSRSQQPTPQILMPNSNEFNMQQRQSRRGSDLQSRNAALQAAAQQAYWDQRANFKVLPPIEMVAEGVSQPVWVDSELLLVRRVEAEGKVLIQGCWLDWPEIRKELLERIESFLPEAQLEPVTDMAKVSFTRVLAAIPAQLVVPEPVAVVNPLSPIRVSLIAVWLFLGLATVSMVVLLRGVVALSERRASFVSAVTHELRTPLTTFRMYAEMLLEGMVTDADQRRTYLGTLKAEADRLAHLVENVLQYARLERGTGKRRREQTRVGELLDRLARRLAERTHQAGMRLEIEAEDDVRDQRVYTDPSAVEQIMFNLVDNACKYAAGSDDRRIHLRLETVGGRLAFRVLDHGPGIAAAERERLFRPFSKSARDAANSAPGVGLGLALCRRLAVDLGGRLEVECTPGNGAVFTLTLPRAVG
jgi:signal transduction histidine kinase